MIPLDADSCRSLVVYDSAVVFHVAMYFCMHMEKHASSLDVKELLGFGMHFSKQFWLMALGSSQR